MKIFSLVNKPPGFVEKVDQAGIPTKAILLGKDSEETIVVGGGSYHRDVLAAFLYKQGIDYQSNQEHDLIQAASVAGYRILGGCDVYTDYMKPAERPMKLSGKSLSFGELSTEQLDRIRTRLGAH